MTSLNYTIFSASFGWMGILASEKGLVSITFPQPSAHQAMEKLGDDVSRATQSPKHFANLACRLRAYFDGNAVTFPDLLDLTNATPFQRTVWEVTRLIPYGETRSYRWLAEQSGKPGAARAAGQALSNNPLPIIIPCHRVVASDGGLGGFSGGLRMKERLLRLEATEHRA